MELCDYAKVRERLWAALAGDDLRVTAEEAVFLTSMSKGCDMFVYLADVDYDIWAKIGFEWTAANQAWHDRFLPVVEGENDALAMEGEAAEIAVHCEFHLHFGAMAVPTGVMRDVATDLEQFAEYFFGDNGGVVAEVLLTADDARLDCLRYEVNAVAPICVEESWWERWGEVTRGMLGRLAEIYTHLEREYGSCCN